MLYIRSQPIPFPPDLTEGGWSIRVRMAERRKIKLYYVEGGGKRAVCERVTANGTLGICYIIVVVISLRGMGDWSLKEEGGGRRYRARGKVQFSWSFHRIRCGSDLIWKEERGVVNLCEDLFGGVNRR
ncbi:hypothetical protein TNCV_777701 [Trichonephila clavipes]|nr:hypothetical protein TNCV_777701 [Trichonephila clavipes]